MISLQTLQLTLFIVIKDTVYLFSFLSAQWTCLRNVLRLAKGSIFPLNYIKYRKTGGPKCIQAAIKDHCSLNAINNCLLHMK